MGVENSGAGMALKIELSGVPALFHGVQINADILKAEL